MSATTAEPSSSTSSASPSKERVEVMSKAVNLMGQGKRNLICGDVPMAVSQFEECCQILAQTYGEMAFECASAYFSYGHALLELARMDSKVIESLEAEAEEDDEEEESEKSEDGKSEDGKSGGETPGTTEDEDRTDKSESLSSQDEILNDKEAKPDTKESTADNDKDDKEGEKEEGADDDDEDEHIAGNDVTNLQLSWESLELAKIIYLKRQDKESQLKAAQAFLKLGEVGLETGVYEQSIEDIKECLKIQKEHLEPEEREIAETYYQLGLVHVFAGNHDPSIENFKEAVTVIEARVEKLNATILKLKDSKETADIDAAYNAKTEVSELEEIVPDIKQKITDTIEEKKTVADLKLMAKKEAEEKLIADATKPGTSSAFGAASAFGTTGFGTSSAFGTTTTGFGTSSGFETMSGMGSISGITTTLGTTITGFNNTDASKVKVVNCPEGKTLDISHLVRRKRKPDGSADDSAEKKQKSESGASTTTDGRSAKTQQDRSNGPLSSSSSSTQHNKVQPTDAKEQTKTKDS